MFVKGNPDRKKKTQRKKLLNLPKKKISIPRMDKKKLHTWEFQLKHSSRNMRRKLLQKRFIGKRTECSKHLRDIAIEKNILSELNRCIFQIPISYSKNTLLYWYYTVLIFTSKLCDPPPPSPPSQAGGGGGCMP